MHFLTEEECKQWLSGRERELPRHDNSAATLTLWYPPNPADIDFLWIAQHIYYREPVLLWITESGIWPSSENWHLYDRLRRSYGDSRLLYEAPDTSSKTTRWTIWQHFCKLWPPTGGEGIKRREQHLIAF